jgi:putative Holliday junction resolvase
MAKFMALDVGEVRIGVAISDATGFLASPYTVLRASRDEQQTWEAIERLIKETEAEGLIVGLPISLDGQLHTQGERVQAFAQRLQAHISIPLILWDERLSTVEAQRLLAERGQQAGGGKRRRREGQRRTNMRRRGASEIDAMAAAVILQDYLDQQGSTTGEKI